MATHANSTTAPKADLDAERKRLLRSYADWLLMERRELIAELGGPPADIYDPNSPGGMYHWRAFEDGPAPAPSTRAAAVLATVGCDWRAPHGDVVEIVRGGECLSR